MTTVTVTVRSAANLTSPAPSEPSARDAAIDDVDLGRLAAAVSAARRGCPACGDLLGSTDEREVFTLFPAYGAVARRVVPRSRVGRDAAAAPGVGSWQLGSASQLCACCAGVASSGHVPADLLAEDVRRDGLPVHVVGRLVLAIGSELGVDVRVSGDWATVASGDAGILGRAIAPHGLEVSTRRGSRGVDLRRCLECATAAWRAELIDDCERLAAAGAEQRDRERVMASEHAACASATFDFLVRRAADHVYGRARWAWIRDDGWLPTAAVAWAQRRELRALVRARKLCESLGVARDWQGNVVIAVRSMPGSTVAERDERSATAYPVASFDEIAYPALAQACLGSASAPSGTSDSGGAAGSAP